MGVRRSLCHSLAVKADEDDSALQAGVVSGYSLLFGGRDKRRRERYRHTEVSHTTGSKRGNRAKIISSYAILEQLLWRFSGDLQRLKEKAVT